VPILIKVTRARNVPPPDAMTREQPQYFTDLGFRTAAVGARTATLVLGVAQAGSAEERLRAFRVEYPDDGGFARLGAERARAVDSSVHGQAEPHALPACPAWMFDRCPYREVCGCGAAPTGGASRLQR
jgi:hypothetical protein